MSLKGARGQKKKSFPFFHTKIECHKKLKCSPQRINLGAIFVVFRINRMIGVQTSGKREDYNP